MSKMSKDWQFCKRAICPAGWKSFLQSHNIINMIDGKRNYDAGAKAHGVEFVPIKEIV